MLNESRRQIVELEDKYGITIEVNVDSALSASMFKMMLNGKDVTLSSDAKHQRKVSKHALKRKQRTLKIRTRRKRPFLTALLRQVIQVSLQKNWKGILRSLTHKTKITIDVGIILTEDGEVSMEVLLLVVEGFRKGSAGSGGISKEALVETFIG